MIASFASIRARRLLAELLGLLHHLLLAIVQGLTLVHFSPVPEPFLTQHRTPKPPKHPLAFRWIRGAFGGCDGVLRG
jgi:hypothetical protein